MKVSKRDLSIIMVLVGLVAAFCAYQFYFRGCLTERNQTMEDVKSLKAEYEELNALMDRLTEFRNSITNNIAAMDKLVQSYPAFYRYEDGIMYLRNLEKNTDSYGVYFSTYTVSQTVLADEYEGKVAEKKGDTFLTKTVNYAYGISTINASYTCDGYNQVKKLVNDVYNEKNDDVPKSIESIAMTFDNTTGKIIGSIAFNLYSLTDGVNNEYVPVDTTLTDSDLGLDNTSENASGIFGTWEPLPEEEEETPVTEATPATEE